MKKLQLVKDHSFYKAFFSIWSVLVLHNIITLGVSRLDNVMVSAYSEAAMAGVSAVNQVQFLFQQLMLGAGDAAVVLGSQYWGQKRTEPIKRIAVGALLLGTVLSLFFLSCSKREKKHKLFFFQLILHTEKDVNTHFIHFQPSDFKKNAENTNLLYFIYSDIVTTT